MGINNDGMRAGDNVREAANRIFEAQLVELGLSRDVLATQSVPELEESLDVVNDALRSPESFGIIRLKLGATNTIIGAGRTEAHLEVGILPLLLDRKTFIMNRLRELRAKRKINTLRDLIETVTDESLRQQLLTELEAAKQQVKTVEQTDEITEGFAFIAMAMNPEDPQLEDILDAIKDGAASCGISAERIDDTQTNARITDRILDAIRKAEFVVVDLSSARPNVYYEAGYAQGLGKTPVFVARAGTEIH